jgi:hypothetical protein
MFAFLPNYTTRLIPVALVPRPGKRRPSLSQTYIYRWNRQGRKDQLCLVLARGTMNSN